MTGKSLKHLRLFYDHSSQSSIFAKKKKYRTDVGNDKRPIVNYIDKFKNQPGIKVIKSRKNKLLVLIMSLMKKFLTKLGNYRENDTAKWYFNKNSETNLRDIPWYFYENVRFCIENTSFPSDLKVVNVTPTFKKKSKTSNGVC